VQVDDSGDSGGSPPQASLFARIAALEQVAAAMRLPATNPTTLLASAAAPAVSNAMQVRLHTRKHLHFLCSALLMISLL
jgi:hypothetical protein